MRPSGTFHFAPLCLSLSLSLFYLSISLTATFTMRPSGTFLYLSSFYLCPSACLSISLFSSLFLYVCIRPSIHLSIYLYLSLSSCLCMYLSINISLYLICLSSIRYAHYLRHTPENVLIDCMTTKEMGFGF